jgi:hypothetical protein
VDALEGPVPGGRWKVRYLPAFTARDRYLGMEGVVPPMATGIMRGARSSEARAVDQPLPAPSPNGSGVVNGLVSLRRLKALVQALEPSNPVRIMVMGEPDEVPRVEYAAKVLCWYRLILSRVDSGPLGVR